MGSHKKKNSGSSSGSQGSINSLTKKQAKKIKEKFESEQAGVENIEGAWENATKQGSKRDLILLLCILRVRLIPCIPWQELVEFIWNIKVFDHVIDRELKKLKLKEKEQKYWAVGFSWEAGPKMTLQNWCKEEVAKEESKCGGRWVAMVNWENERIMKLMEIANLDLEKHHLLDDEGILKLREDVGWDKYLIKLRKESDEMREQLEASLEAELQLQSKWVAEGDFRAYSFPDDGTPSLQPPIGTPRRTGEAHKSRDSSRSTDLEKNDGLSSTSSRSRGNTFYSDTYSAIPLETNVRNLLLRDEIEENEKVMLHQILRRGLERMMQNDTVESWQDGCWIPCQSEYPIPIVY